jgi:phosphoribosylglycinamide formyltransferase-1
MARHLRIAALASGRGSNLAALNAACGEGRIDGEIVFIGSDKADSGVMRMAADAGIEALALDPTHYASRRDFDLALFEHVAASGADLLVLAGFMRIIDPAALLPWVGRAINIHPSLLPLYRGLHTHRRALRAGDREHGASVHYVTAELDGGPVIAQRRIAIGEHDTEASLAARLLAEEHRLLPAVVAAIAAGRIGYLDDRPSFDGTPLDQPLRLSDAGTLLAGHT